MSKTISVVPIDRSHLWTPGGFQTWLRMQTKGLKNAMVEFVVDDGVCDLVIQADNLPAEKAMVVHRFAPAGIMGISANDDFEQDRCFCGKPESHPVHQLV